jgi:hypothetical protein
MIPSHSLEVGMRRMSQLIIIQDFTGDWVIYQCLKSLGRERIIRIGRTFTDQE